jgi:phosphatidylglycerophosphatase A
MTAKTDPDARADVSLTSESSASAPAPDSPTSPSSPPRRKPRISLFIATACGLGYLPKAPGTWGSLLGVLIYFAWYANERFYLSVVDAFPTQHHFVLWVQRDLAWAAFLSILLAAVGVWVSNRVSKFSRSKDPQFVVIDEVSGQQITLLLGLVLSIHWRTVGNGWPGYPFAAGPFSWANWKYLLLGFILFRVFDIWKPFPARQAESLPGGWGIMADDWIAAIYAGLGLWLARALGL